MARIGIIVPDQLKEALDGIAASQERNLSWVCRKAFEEYIQNHQQEKKED